MPTRFRRLGPVAALLVALGLAGPIVGTRAAEEEVYVVIVSPDVEVENVTLEEIERIFHFSKRYWNSGKRVTILYSEESLEDGSFLTSVIYGMEFPRIRRLILEKLYQGELDMAPKVVANDRTVSEFVALGQGLVSVVRVDSVGDADVKILRVDGHGPESDGYTLRR